jgi:hypothetical protein
MTTDHRPLALRRHSIRTLTTAELSLAHGARGNGTGGDAPTCAGGCNTNTTRTTARTK